MKNHSFTHMTMALGSGENPSPTCPAKSSSYVFVNIKYKEACGSPSWPLRHPCSGLLWTPRCRNDRWLSAVLGNSMTEARGCGSLNQYRKCLHYRVSPTSRQGQSSCCTLPHNDSQHRRWVLCCLSIICFPPSLPPPHQFPIPLLTLCLPMMAKQGDIDLEFIKLWSCNFVRNGDGPSAMIRKWLLWWKADPGSQAPRLSGS